MTQRKHRYGLYESSAQGDWAHHVWSNVQRKIPKADQGSVPPKGKQ